MEKKQKSKPIIDVTVDQPHERQPKCKETNYLEEIDDGPKRLTSRSDYKRTVSIDVLEDRPQSSVDEQNNGNEENQELPNLHAEEDENDIYMNGTTTKSALKSEDKGAEKNDAKPKSENKTKKKDEKRSVFRSNDAGNGIAIILPTYLLPEDSYLESLVWTPEERGLFLKENNFTNQQRFRTDIYHIYKKGPCEAQKSNGSYKSMSYPEISQSDITVNVHIPELSQMNCLCLNFRAHIRFGKHWTLIDANYIHTEGVVTFNCNQIESFCIVSTPRHDKHIVTPDGYEFVSEADNRIKVDFPVGSVSQDENVEFKVIPLNRESMATKILSNPGNCFILAISECLSVRHSVSSFDQPVDIQLPVDDLPGIDTTNIECKYGVFKRKHTGSFRLTNLEVDERYGVPTVTVNSFSEYVILKVRRDMFGKLQSLLPEVIEDAIGDKMCCKILFFAGSRKPNSMSVMLECVTKDSMEEVTHRRRSMGYELVRQCPSPDFFFPVNQRIRVSVAGKFALTKHIGRGYYFLTFFPIAADNFICFPVDRHTGMESAAYGIISFKEDNGTKKDLHVIHYDPWSSRGKPQGNPRMSFTQSAPVSRLVTAATDERRDRLDTNVDEIFFSDKGLLAVAQLLGPDAMFKVVINLDMTKTQYEQITNNYSALSTASRHLQLLKTALEISSNETKLQRLVSALTDSDENVIAEKIEALYINKMSLSKSNLERRPTMVSIKMEDTTISGKV